MILAVIGSRDFNDEEFIFNKLDELNKDAIITAIISGGAKGVDLIGKKWALKNNIIYIEKTPNWNSPTQGVPMKKNKYGQMFNPVAGHERNTLIVNECDQLIAFWDGVSKGTKDSINKAKAQNKVLEIVYVNNRQR